MLAFLLAIALAQPWEPMPSHDGATWFEARLAENTPDDARLAFRSYAGALEIFLDERRIYAFSDKANAGRLTIHLVDLPRGAAGKRLRVRITSPARGPFIGGTRVVRRAELPRELVALISEPMNSDIDDLVTGAIIAMVGFFSIAIADLRRRGDTRPLLYFGFFALFYGLRLIVQSMLMPLLGTRMETARQIEWIITYVINIPGWMLSRRLIGDGWKSTLRWQVWAFAIFAPIAIASDFIRNEPASMEAANNVLVVIGGVNVLFNLIHGGIRRHSRELKVILAGSMVFLAFALANNLSSLNVLPFEEFDETLGFVVFLATLGYAATRRFASTEREQIALDGELAAAREIQRSILPSSMPRTEGLAFDARYVPASSVAGDLYDFLEIDDQHTGVIVADVSGHGVPAALIASMVKIAVSSQTRLAGDPAAMLHELNAILSREVRRGFVTATYLAIDTNAMRADVANAGHPAPLLLRDGTIRELGAAGPLLGRFRSASYSSAAVELQRGDRILAYTDGIIEARNARGEEFGEERLHALLRKPAPLSEFVEAVRVWRGGASDADDLTLVMIDVTV